MQDTKRPTPLRESPFAFTRPVERRGLIDRLLNRPRPDLAERALRHLLSHRDPTRISATDVSALFLEYDVSGPGARSVLVHIWRQVLSVFLTDDTFTDREIAYLEALRAALALTEDEIARAEREVVHPRWSIALAEALADARLSDAERVMLDRLAGQLRLTGTVRHDLFARASRAAISGVADRSIADRRLSPDEQAELDSVARQLGVSPDFDGATQALLDRYALFWSIENREVPSVPAGSFPLAGGETCHLVLPAERYETRPASDAVASEGIVSVRIARGVYYRAGTESREAIDRAPLRHVDSGRFLVTSRRVVFEGAGPPAMVSLREIASYQVHADGIVLERRASVGPYFVLDGDVELAAVILGAALARA